MNDDNEELVTPSRTKKNKDLYRQISENELNEVKVNLNASVLNVEGTEIDIDRLRQILDKKYRETPRKSIDINGIEEDIIPRPEITKEYDLSSFIEKAKETKETNYEEDRLKKIRDTQFDILKNIKIDKDEEDEDDTEGELMSLIETITHKNDDAEEINLFPELTENAEDEILPKDIEQQEENTFYTGNLKVQDNDYEEFNELKKEIGSNSIIIKILLVLFFIIVIFGIIFFLDKTFAWGIF